MNRKNLLFTLFICGFTLLSLSVLVFSLPQEKTLTTSSTQTDPIIINLYNGSYGDYDQDGNEDDLRVFLDITIDQETIRSNFICDIHVILPNGDTYSYSVLVSTVLDRVSFKLEFINHAYTPGDYIIKAEVNLFNYGFFYDSAEIVFDPPTEKIPDDEPYMTIS